MTKKKFKELDDSEKAYIQSVHMDDSLPWDERMSILRNRFQIAERTVRRWIKKLGFSKYEYIESEEFRNAKLKAIDEGKKRFIVTWAQNATAVHLSFWKNIQAYAEFIDASIHVVAGRYLNPSLYKTQNKLNPHEWWDHEVTEHLDAGRHQIHEYVTLLSDIKVQPTAANPLSGFQGVSGNSTTIIGHPKVHLQSLPTLEGHPNKLMLTTGACTVKNYSDTKAGKKGEFHHTLGFAIVEIRDDLTYYVRQVTATDSGNFSDLFWHVENERVSKLKTCSAFVLGDIHADQVYFPVVEKTLELFEHLEPRNTIFHDLINGTSVNPHERKNPIKAYENYKEGKHLVANEIEGCMEFLEAFRDYKPIVVRSNHDVFCDRWIIEQDWKKDIQNSEKYMEWSLALLQGRADKGILPYIINERFGNEVIALDLDDSYKINGWEVGHHGHLGSNGSRGSINQYSKLSTKVIIAHGHHPERRNGAIMVGTYSELRMGYNKGASNWMHAGAIVHEDGKAQLIIFNEDDYTTLYDKLE